jgi:hypothetical protein
MFSDGEDNKQVRERQASGVSYCPRSAVSVDVDVPYDFLELSALPLRSLRLRGKFCRRR